MLNNIMVDAIIGFQLSTRMMVSTIRGHCKLDVF